MQPTRLLDAVAKAVLPSINAEGDDLKEGVSMFYAYRAVAPLFGDYNVADAVHFLPMLSRAINTGTAGRVGSAEVKRNHAWFVAQWLLEDFVAMARASGADCAKARAQILAVALDDDGVLSDDGERAAAFSLQRDIRDLIASKFAGELFGDYAEGKPSGRLYQSLSAREQLSYFAVDEMRDARAT